jgi:hypothetical protein
MKENLRQNSFTGKPKHTLSKARKWACFHRGPAFGKHGWDLLSWGLLIRTIFMSSLRDIQTDP